MEYKTVVAVDEATKNFMTSLDESINSLLTLLVEQNLKKIRSTVEALDDSIVANGRSIDKMTAQSKKSTDSLAQAMEEILKAQKDALLSTIEEKLVAQETQMTSAIASAFSKDELIATIEEKLAVQEVKMTSAIAAVISKERSAIVSELHQVQSTLAKMLGEIADRQERFDKQAMVLEERLSSHEEQISKQLQDFAQEIVARQAATEEQLSVANTGIEYLKLPFYKRKTAREQSQT